MELTPSRASETRDEESVLGDKEVEAAGEGRVLWSTMTGEEEVLSCEADRVRLSSDETSENSEEGVELCRVCMVGE